VTPTELNDRARTVGLLAQTAFTLSDSPEKALMTQVATALARSIDRTLNPPVLVDCSNGKVIPIR
jgi:hypothetical protein